MRDGDLVRFRHELTSKRRRDDCGVWEWKLGFLVEYKKWEKVATILYEGNLIRVRAEYVQKAGKKDMTNESNSI